MIGSQDVRQLIDPLAELPIQSSLEPPSDSPVGGLGLPVALGIGHQRVEDHDVMLLVEDLDNDSHKLGAVVQKNSVRDPESRNDVLPDEVFNVSNRSLDQR